MISVIGLGFVGLTTALGLAYYGHQVYGVDNNNERVEIIKRKALPFMEPGLDKALERELGNHFLVAENIKEAMIQSSVVFLCVGTPCGENGEADLNCLLTAIKQCIQHRDINRKYTFVIKSTIPPTTTREVIIPYIKKMGLEPGKDINIANNPEFLREGNCWEDFINADRIVVGVSDNETERIMEAIYKPFHVQMCFVSYNTSEFIKYLSNTMLATMISFANEMATIADEIGNIDIKEAFRIIHMDKRWDGCSMKSYVYPGCGYGGYCLPKDTKALYSLAQSINIETGILENVIKTNDNMAYSIVKRVKRQIKVSDTIGILGLSFKPGSDDVRDSAAAKIIEELLYQGYKNIIAYDPVATEVFMKVYSYDIEYEKSLEKLLAKSDVYIIVTAWEEFRKIKEQSEKLVLDYRYM